MSTLTCPACGRQVPTAGASGIPAFCPFCGASLLADNDGETRPALAEELPTQSIPPTAPTALVAAATPAQGGAAPAKGASGDGDGDPSGETRDLPASALPRPKGMGGGTVARGVGIVALLALLVAIIVVAAFAVNGGLPFTANSVATPTRTPERPTATASVNVYQSSGLYQIAYPLDWTATEQNNPPQTYSVALIDPHSGATVNVTAQQTSAYVDPAVNDTNYLNGLAAPTNTKAKNISDPQAVTLAGQTWTAESGDVSLLQSDGSTQYAHAVAMSVDHGQRLYTIVRLVPVTTPSAAASTFASVDLATFQTILASFRFLS